MSESAIAPDLASWLLEQIAEDERAARSAIGETEVFTLDGGTLHYTRWPPFRVLAECETKRRIVERYVYLSEHGDSGDARWVLPALALPYADRPGYREEWRP